MENYKNKYLKYKKKYLNLKISNKFNNIMIGGVWNQTDEDIDLASYYDIPISGATKIKFTQLYNIYINLITYLKNTINANTRQSLYDYYLDEYKQKLEEFRQELNRLKTIFSDGHLEAEILRFTGFTKAELEETSKDEEYFIQDITDDFGKLLVHILRTRNDNCQSFLEVNNKTRQPVRIIFDTKENNHVGTIWEYKDKKILFCPNDQVPYFIVNGVKISVPWTEKGEFNFYDPKFRMYERPLRERERALHYARFLKSNNDGICGVIAIAIREYIIKRLNELKRFAEIGGTDDEKHNIIIKELKEINTGDLLLYVATEINI